VHLSNIHKAVSVTVGTLESKVQLLRGLPEV
jgi:hypothetical protein